MKYCWSRGVYRSGQQQFLNANFVWNQDEVSQNSCYAKRDFTIVDSLALRAVRVKPISCALRACFLGHYRMARMSQSASSCGLASWMRPQQCNTSMIPDTHLLKLLFPTRYTPRSIHQDFYQAFYIREIYIVSVSSNFPVPKGHDANFAWNQYETAIKFVGE